jgi:hypothetical protein
MFAARPAAFASKSLLTEGEEVTADPTYVLTNYGLRIMLSIYDVHCGEEEGKSRGWIGYKLKVRELEDISVVTQFPIKMKMSPLAFWETSRVVNPLASC